MITSRQFWTLRTVPSRLVTEHVCVPPAVMGSVQNMVPTMSRVLNLEPELSSVVDTSDDPLIPDIASVQVMAPDLERVIDMKPTIKTVEES